MPYVGSTRRCAARDVAWLEALPANLQDMLSLRHCRQSLISTLASFRRLNRRPASAATEQQDGLTGIGHDDAWKGGETIANTV
jgi:hypothetical protein